MTNEAVSSVHIQKLGHCLQEIRVRALHSILSKLNRGFIQDRELASRPELLKKLIEWFGFDVVSEEENILELVLRILKADKEGDLLMLLKMPDMTKLLDMIREKLCNSKLLDLLEQICEMVSNCQRTADSTQVDSCRSSEDGGETSRTATTFEMFVHGSEGEKLCQDSGNSSAHYHDFFSPPGGPCPRRLLACFPCLVLPWQPLCPTDQHVLGTVEESVVRTPGRACRFFCHVMLQDFPAEVFLQRPCVVKTFLTLLQPSRENTQSIRSLVLKCLYDLTNSLRIRVEYYADPCMHNFKQEVGVRRGSSTSTPASQLARSDSCSEGQPTAGQYLQDCDLGQSPPGQPPADYEDQLVLQLQQLGLPQFCLSVLEQALPLVPTARAFPLVWSIVNLLSSCVTATLWLSTDQVAQEVSQMVKKVFSSLGDALEYCRYSCRLSYLQLLSVVPKLLSQLVLPDLADVAVPAKLRVILADSLFDYPLLALYPQLHSQLLDHMQMFSDPHIQEKLCLYSDSTKFCGSLKTTAKLLKSSGELSGRDFLSAVDNALLSIPYHENMSVVKLAVDVYFSKAYSWHLDDELRKQSSDILLKLFAHAELSVRLETYKSCHRHVVAAFGVSHVHYPQAANRIILLFNTSLLVDILCHGASSPTKQIQQYAEEILIHLLKGKFLISDQMWRKFVESLIPTLPLLLCYASKSTALGRVITKMLDPDISSTTFFSNFVVLKGNLCLLFSDDPFLREEALTRLVWLLTKQPRSSEFLPHLLSVSTAELNNIFIVDEKFNLYHSKLPQVFYEPGSLCQVMELLESSFVESAVRKSALTQISVMLGDPHLHATFIELKGLELVVKIFHTALIKMDFTNSPESVIPIISILGCLVHHNSTVRQELALQEFLFYSILRAGLMFRENQRHCMGVAHLLSLLLYSDYLLPTASSEEHAHRSDLSLPHLVVSGMHLPFHSTSHWYCSPHTQASFKGMTREDEVRRLLSHCWAVEWFGGVESLLNWSCVQSAPNCSAELQLSSADLATLKQSAVTLVCEESLREVHTADSHRTVYMLLNTLTGYTWLQMALGGGADSWDKLPWEETFRRFLVTQPACAEDDKLLVEVLEFLRLHLSVFPSKGVECEWLGQSLRAPDGPVLGLLETVGMGGDEEPSRELCLAALQLCKDCDTKGWGALVIAISRCLRCSDSQHFYNLALLVWMLSCLAHVTSCPRWSIEAQVNWYELTSCLLGLVVAFHCGSNAGSFMGLAITRSAVLCMNHLLAEMQECADMKEWAEVWQLTLGELYQLWMSSLWQCRDPVVRAGSLQLLAGLCMSPHLCAAILTTFDLLSMALSFVVDHQEASLVREYASNLLTNITSHKMNTTSSSEVDALQESLQDLAEILEKYEFYQQLMLILSQLHLAERVRPCEPYLGKWRVESLSERKLSPRDCRPDDQIILVYDAAPGQVNSSSKPDSEVSGSERDDKYPLSVTSPSLVGACCWLLVNLLAVNERHTLTNLMDHGIIVALFGCLGGASTPADCSTSLYADLVEMRSAVCSLLCKCAALSAACCTAVLRLPGCLHTLLLLVQPADYRTNSEQMLFLRNRLWSEVFRLLSALLSHRAGENGSDGFKAVCNVLRQCGHAPFLEAVKLSLISDLSPDLQNSSLVSLTCLLSPEVADTVTRKNNLDPSAGDVASSYSIQSLLDNSSSVIASPATSPANNAEGAELCELLLRLFDAYLVQHSKCGNLGKGAVVTALSSLLAISHTAKHHALQRDLHVSLVAHARDLHMRLNLDSAQFLRTLSHKRRICPVLDDLRVLLGMLTNFMAGSSSVKTAVVHVGLADLVHKVWVWCTAVPNFMVETLQLLCTLTTDCIPGSHSLVLTTTVPGMGLRKSPSAASLLHVMIALLQKEMDLVSHCHDQQILALIFQLLQNACHSQECRIILAKQGSLLQCFLLLHPSHTKSQKCWDSVETLWLQFLSHFTFHPEGQLALPKVQDCMELLLWLTSCARRSTHILSLVVLRNISFHQLNRPRLLTSPEFFRVLVQALGKGEAEEKGLAASMVWALVANNQKAKLVLKCTGLVTRLQEALHQLSTTPDHSSTVRVLEYVLRLLLPDGR